MGKRKAGAVDQVSESSVAAANGRRRFIPDNDGGRGPPLQKTDSNPSRSTTCHSVGVASVVSFFLFIHS
jgi:hypothetical protein